MLDFCHYLLTYVKWATVTPRSNISYTEEIWGQDRRREGERKKPYTFCISKLLCQLLWNHTLSSSFPCSQQRDRQYPLGMIQSNSHYSFWVTVWRSCFPINHKWAWRADFVARQTLHLWNVSQSNQVVCSTCQMICSVTLQLFCTISY